MSTRAGAVTATPHSSRVPCAPPQPPHTYCAHAIAHRELRAAQERLSDEVWVESTQLWERSRGEVAALRGEVAARDAQLAALAAERDEARRGEAARAAQAEVRSVMFLCMGVE